MSSSKNAFLQSQACWLWCQWNFLDHVLDFPSCRPHTMFAGSPLRPWRSLQCRTRCSSPCHPDWSDDGRYRSTGRQIQEYASALRGCSVLWWWISPILHGTTFKIPIVWWVVWPILRKLNLSILQSLSNPSGHGHSQCGKVSLMSNHLTLQKKIIGQCLSPYPEWSLSFFFNSALLPPEQF